MTLLLTDCIGGFISVIHKRISVHGRKKERKKGIGPSGIARVGSLEWRSSVFEGGKEKMKLALETFRPLSQKVPSFNSVNGDLMSSFCCFEMSFSFRFLGLFLAPLIRFLTGVERYNVYWPHNQPQVNNGVIDQKVLEKVLENVYHDEGHSWSTQIGFVFPYLLWEGNHVKLEHMVQDDCRIGL